MPTAVGPNTFGEENLVFGYDTGDTVNSYRGEPVTNLWDSMLNTQSLRTHTKHYWDSKKWTEDATYTHPGVEGPRGVYLGLVFKHVSGALNSSWSNTSYGYMLRDIACTNGATMAMSSWIYASQDCDVDAIPAVIEQEAGGESSVTGYPAQYDLTNKGTWQVVAKKATSDGQVRFIPLYPRKGGVTDGSFAGFFMWALPQVTYGDHVVQPIQPGTTRSATQGLIDLTGNSTIDLTNVSFDSNAQMTFDGTNDKIHGVSTPLSYLSSSAFEFVVTPESTGVRMMIGGYRHNEGYSSPTIGAVYIDTDNKFKASVITTAEVYRYAESTTTTSANQTYHVVLNKDTVTGVMQLYINGVGEGAQTFNAATYGQWSSAGSYIGSNNLDFGKSFNTNSGQGWSGDFLDGKIHSIKLYSRTLTAQEVRSNFNAIKGRFGI
jgi:hypothetical protein